MNTKRVLVSGSSEAVRRLFDLTAAALGLVVTAPVLLIAMLGIRLSRVRPVVYRAQRVGRDGREFTLYKLRTMRPGAELGGPITADKDPRVFAFGAWLRRWKVDELPQLLNVLRGEMAIVGPRPENPEIVRQYYSVEGLETLKILPGLTSPGSVYFCTHGERLLRGERVVTDYVERLLPLKLELDRVYVHRASLSYDLRIVGRTVWMLAARAARRTRFPDPPELRELAAIAEVGGSTAKLQGVAWTPES